MPALAAIDVGSNAMRLLIGQVDEKGSIVTVDNFREAVRLGKDVFSRAEISPETISSAVEALGKFRKIMDQHGVTRYRAVATSALREASNASRFVEQIASSCRINLEIISADEEARLVFLAAASRIKFSRGYSLLIDIGGGSVEVSLVSDAEIVKSESYQIGTVRLLQLFSEKKQGDRVFLRMVEKYVRAIRRELKRELGEFWISRCIATGGNVESLGELRVSRLGRSRNDCIKAKELDELIGILGSMTLEQRTSELRLRPDRADVILPAAIILSQVLSEIELNEIRIPHVGLKDGLLLDCLNSIEQPETSAHRRELRAFARALGRKYRYDRAHADVVSSLAITIFDQTRLLHKLGDDARLLLELAALLHDIGHFISVNGHHKHSCYLISSSPFVGLSPREKGIVAAVARYHRKALPSEEHHEFSCLSIPDRRIVVQLAAILRIADAIDREHTGIAPKVLLTLEGESLSLSIEGKSDSQLERWAVMERGKLFEDAFGHKLNVQ